MFKPEPDEFDDYYSHYISFVPESDIRDAFASQPSELRRLIGGVDEAGGSFRYAEGKWTVKELLSHLIDGERIFSYRMLRISRGDVTPIEGFEQDGYIENSRANDRPFDELLAEFELIRKANVLMLNSLDAVALARMGTASGLPISVRALANISIGHVRHHISILNEKYLPNLK
ncbi:MAG TPA: DinB family protein [Pyrinomonadaceae bacterium]|nr:DinB family protein [Pyrinomonadaceae bacterium]